MRPVPESIAPFLQGRRFAVAGVSRSGQSAGNPVLEKLRKAGYEAIPVNPNSTSIDGAACFRDLASIPGTLDGVVIATHPRPCSRVIRSCVASAEVVIPASAVRVLC